MLTDIDRGIHVLARLGIRRNGWRVSPGLYSLGNAGGTSPVFVSANYKLSFDSLRESLAGMDAWIMVLDTKGINVWCAAGKGSFGTDEMSSRIVKTGLADVVEHREVIAPQLSATGVCAREVRRRTGFKVVFGPVRAGDIGEFARTGEATPEMRTVKFTLKDRVVLIPVEAVNAAPFVSAGILASLLAGERAGAAGIAAAATAGLVGFPVLMPWLPGDDFSAKGLALGGAVGLGGALLVLFTDDDSPLWVRLMRAASFALALPAITSFIALNFTGSTPVASPSMVKREMSTYVPVVAWMAGAGVLLNVAEKLLRLRSR